MDILSLPFNFYFYFTLARSNNPQVISFLLQNNADVNKTNKDGETPLHRGCKIGNLDIVKLLINNGASINLINRFGWYPIPSSLV